jgi:hypothetical protein
LFKELKRFVQRFGKDLNKDWVKDLTKDWLGVFILKEYIFIIWFRNSPLKNIFYTCDEVFLKEILFVLPTYFENVSCQRFGWNILQDKYIFTSNIFTSPRNIFSEYIGYILENNIGYIFTYY